MPRPSYGEQCLDHISKDIRNTNRNLRDICKEIERFNSNLEIFINDYRKVHKFELEGETNEPN